MTKTITREQDPRIEENQITVTAKRALGLNRFYVAIATFIGLGALSFLVPTFANPSNHTIDISSVTVTIPPLPLLAVPLSVLPVIMLTTPMVVLFVYDKNNGVLEYVISLGMTQRDVYGRYLRAALLVAVSYLLIFGTLNLLYSSVRFGTAYLSTTLVIQGIGAIIGVSTVAFIMAMMMIFSSLQKSRTGGNQPLAITLGLVAVFPDYFIPFILHYNTAIAVETVQGAIIAVVALIPILMSSRLVSREKFLP